MVLDRPDKANQHWSMDFVSDSLWNGRRFRVLTIVDDLTRECPALEVDHSLPGLRVTRVLESLAATRGLPEVITLDNGPEFVSRAMDDWAHENNVRLRFIQPGKPVQNAYMKASTASCATNASTKTFSSTCTMRKRKSKHGAGITTPSDHTVH